MTLCPTCIENTIFALEKMASYMQMPLGLVLGFAAALATDAILEKIWPSRNQP